MAFHVACPLTCRRVCYCELGFPAALRGAAAKEAFVADVAAVERFRADPWVLRVAGDGSSGNDGGTVQVLVPPVGRVGDEEAEAAAAARRHAEEYARRIEAGAAAVEAEMQTELGTHPGQHELGVSLVKVICRLCFSGEDEGSGRAAKMLPCKSCGKKYHRHCLKSWGRYRDLFHWSSWSCPYCRSCDACKSVGDPNKLMYCKRCDGALHCYCQQPPHKNVSQGPYLCPKHTRCHSCGSAVPGSGHSTRWFLGYTCCDACGRLFVKGNYCPICLKVYRDSEVIPMVCCDVCEKWIHIECDGISEERYQQFQTDQNLQYTCAACRGECYQIKDLEDAIRELWDRRDMADFDLMVSLRAAAGLPSSEDFNLGSPFSDDEFVEPVAPKSDAKNTLKFSLKNTSEKPLSSLLVEQEKNVLTFSVSPKKSSKKKGSQAKLIGEQEIFLERKNEPRGLGGTFKDETNDDKMLQNNGTEYHLKSLPGRLDRETAGVSKLSSENSVDIIPKVKINVSKASSASKTPSVRFKTAGGEVDKSEPSKGKKLVLHLPNRSRNANGSPRSETSSCQREQELNHAKGSKIETNQIRQQEDGTKDNSNSKLEKDSRSKHKSGGLQDLIETGRPNTGKRSNSMAGIGTDAMNRSAIKLKTSGQKQFTSLSPTSQKDDHAAHPSVADSSDLKPVLKLKLKSSCTDQQSAWSSQQELSTVKRQRSKRKRPSTENVSALEGEGQPKVVTEGSLAGATSTRNNKHKSGEGSMDGKILKKLREGAVGKRVEVISSADGSWHPGMITKVYKGTSQVLVQLDDGRAEKLDLEKQGVRFDLSEPKGSKS